MSLHRSPGHEDFGLAHATPSWLDISESLADAQNGAPAFGSVTFPSLGGPRPTSSATQNPTHLLCIVPNPRVQFLSIYSPTFPEYIHLSDFTKITRGQVILFLVCPTPAFPPRSFASPHDIDTTATANSSMWIWSSRSPAWSPLVASRHSYNRPKFSHGLQSLV